MLKCYEVIRLCFKGVPLFTAWRKSITKINRFDKLMVLMIVGFLLYAVFIYGIAVLMFHLRDLEADKYTALHEAQVHAQAREQSDKVIVGILNGEGVIEDGVDRPCGCGEYKNGVARYTRG
jgi:hypothetical protein